MEGTGLPERGIEMVKWYNNLRVNFRVIISFMCLDAFAIVMSIISVFSITSVDTAYSSMIQNRLEQLYTVSRIRTAFWDSRYILRDSAYSLNDAPALDNAKIRLEAIRQGVQNSLDTYMSDLAANNAKAEVIRTGETMREGFGNFLTESQQVCDKAKTCTIEELAYEVETVMQRYEVSVSSEIDRMIERLEEDIFAASKSISQETTKKAYLMSILLFLFILTAFTLLLFLSRSLRIPLRRLIVSFKEVSVGNINASFSSNYHDEVGQLTNQSALILDTLQRVLSEIKTASQKQIEGVTDYRIDEEAFTGIFRDVAETVNSLTEDFNIKVEKILTCVNAYAEGNFNEMLMPLPGQQAIANEAVDLLQKNLKSVVRDVNELVQGATIGDLSREMDASKYQGDWNKFAVSMNKLLNAIVAPVHEVSGVLYEISQGNLHVSVTGDYRGEFLEMKNALNKTVTTLNDYIGDISNVLDMLSKDNYDVDVELNYIGDFAPIKEEMNMIIERVNFVMTDINASTDQVAAGARQISESSMNLSQGAAEQAGAMERLNVTIDNISEKTRANAIIAKRANGLAGTARSSAETGNVDMRNMLEAMDAINKASGDIAKIIKAIDDIAFQTNLLAINAAVEAAHAGVHGRGFTVVAEQVGELSRRSKEAAENTTVLIEDSILRVSEGMEIANQTAETLDQIVTSISEISELVNEIDVASEEQSRDIAEINIGIAQISQVTQTNTATSEEEAAFAQQLASQSETFKNMVAKFNLKHPENMKRE